MNRVEAFIIDKNSGTNLYKYSILGMENGEKDELLSNFLTALNKITKEVGLSEISMIRFGMGNEARFYSGKYIFTVFIIEFGYNYPLDGMMTQQVLSGLAKEITFTFEKKYEMYLSQSKDMKIHQPGVFEGFRDKIDIILNRAGDEAYRLYQKSILMEAIKMEEDEHFILPMLKRLNRGEDILQEFEIFIDKHSRLQSAVKRINLRHAAVWEIFAIPTYDYSR